MSTLAERITELAKDLKRGWQAQLARDCGLSPPSVSDWVSGKTKTLEGENLLKAAKFFGCTPQWLATGLGPMRPSTGEVTQENVVRELRATYQPAPYWPFKVSAETFQRLLNKEDIKDVDLFIQGIVRARENDVRKSN